MPLPPAASPVLALAVKRGGDMGFPSGPPNSIRFLKLIDLVSYDRRRASLVARLLRRLPQRRWGLLARAAVTRMRARRGSGTRCAARGVALMCLILLGAAGALVLPLGAPLTGLAAASSAAPYTDANAVGSIGLCNQAGQQISSGSVTAQPFAWRAVSTQPAPAPYNNAGRTATLVAYQPQQGLPPGDWSGTQLTSSSSYSNPANPMAAATAADQSLKDIVEAYPPRWDGFLQLRIYLGTVNEQAYTVHYPALNIQVTGSTWQAVGGSRVNCASGTSVSLESELLPSTTTSAPTTSPTTTASAGGTSAGTTPSTDPHASESKGATHGPAVASGVPVAADASPASDHLPLVLGVAVAVLVLLAASASLLFRRRRLAARAVNPVLSSSPSTSTKGDTP